MKILFVFVVYLIVLICVTGVKGGVCPGYNMPVLWPCSDGTITGNKFLVDTSEIPIDRLQCNCKLTTTTNAIQISLLKAPNYRNCGTQIKFSTDSSVYFECIQSGTVLKTDSIKTVDVMVDKDSTLADTKYCFYIEASSSSTNFMANMSLTCSSHRSTEAPTTNITTPLASTASTSTSRSSLSTPTVKSTSPSATTGIPTPSSAMSSKTASISTAQTSTASSAIPTSTSYSKSTNPITTDVKTTITSSVKTSSSTAKSVQTDVTNTRPTTKMTNTPPVTSNQMSEMTTTEADQGSKTISSEGVTMETSSIFIVSTEAKEIGDSTVSDSDFTVVSEKPPNTQQSTTSYNSTSPSNVTLTEDEEGANPERLTVVIVIATIIGVILICVLIGAIYYQKKQKQKVSLNQRSGFTNMASTTVDEEKASKEYSKNHIHDNPNLIPYGHMETS